MRQYELGEIIRILKRFKRPATLGMYEKLKRLTEDKNKAEQLDENKKATVLDLLHLAERIYF